MTDSNRSAPLDQRRSQTLDAHPDTPESVQQRQQRSWPAWTRTVFRAVIGGTFVIAGLTKVGDPLATVNSVRAYKLLPDDVARIVGYALPTVEIVIGALLLLGIATRFAAVATTVLMVAFVIGVSAAWARGMSIDCGCFGNSTSFARDVPVKEYTFVIVRDIAFAAAAVALALRPTSRLALIDRHPPTPTAAD